MNRLENKGVSEIKRQCGKHGISTPELILHLDIFPVRIYEIFAGRRRITPDTDLRLCKFFNLEKGYFCKLQLEYDLKMAGIELEEKLAKITPVDKIVKRVKFE